MNIRNKISLTGDLGSGKSAVSRLLEESLGYRIVSTGGIQREIAAKYGMSTLELNEYTDTHPEIDDEIDGKVTELSEQAEPLIFDSRLAWHFAPSSFKIYLLVDSYVAAERIFNDKRTSEKYTDIEEARQKILARRQSELERFKSYYNIDYSNLHNFDLVIETTHASPVEIAECIMGNYIKWQKDLKYSAMNLSPKSLFPTRMVCCSLDKDIADVRVLKMESYFLILEGHQQVAKAIAENNKLIAVECVFEGYDELISSLKSSYLKQWEDMNFTRFREYPQIYK